MYKGLKLTNFEKEIVEFIARYGVKNKKMPFLYEIAAGVETNDRVVAKSLNRIYKNYPKELIVTTRNKELFDMFESGMTLQELAIKANTSTENVRRHKRGIERLGAKFRETEVIAKIKQFDIKKSIAEKTGERLVGIKVTDGPYKGYYGYLGKKSKVIIHVGGEPIQIECEYVEIGCATGV